jgi:hypothetical protein
MHSRLLIVTYITVLRTRIPFYINAGINYMQPWRPRLMMAWYEWN